MRDLLAGLQHDSIHNRQPMGVPLKEKFLPQHLKALGYSTHAVGKVGFKSCLQRLSVCLYM